MKKLVLISVVSAFLIGDAGAFAKSEYGYFDLNGIGITFETNIIGREFDSGVYGTYRHGVMKFLSIFSFGDFGYRFSSNALSARAGFAAGFPNFGLEMGGVVKTGTNRGYAKSDPGIFGGFQFSLPQISSMLFISSGTSYYYRSQKYEFYAKASVVFNLFGRGGP